MYRQLAAPVLDSMDDRIRRTRRKYFLIRVYVSVRYALPSNASAIESQIRGSGGGGGAGAAAFAISFVQEGMSPFCCGSRLPVCEVRDGVIQWMMNEEEEETAGTLSAKTMPQLARLSSNRILYHVDAGQRHTPLSSQIQGTKVQTAREKGFHLFLLCSCIPMICYSGKSERK